MAEETSRVGQTADALSGVDLRWVWQEVRKRVFIKLPFSLGIADAMEAIVPIALDDDTFICGLASRDYPLATALVPDQVKNTIEGILRQAAGRFIRLEVIEGTSMDDWIEVKERRQLAQEAVIAMAEQQSSAHHFEDIMNQIVSEIRQRITVSKDRTLPLVRASLVLDVVPSLADAEEMLFPDPTAHEARRSMSRVIDRIAGFLEVPPMTLALELERYRRALNPNAASRIAIRKRASPSTPAGATATGATATGATATGATPVSEAALTPTAHAPNAPTEVAAQA